MEAWYALNTKPHSEFRVHRTLETRGFTTFLPLLPPRRDGSVHPLFPAYLFVHCDLDIIGLSSLEWIPGLRRIVAFDGQPAVVPDDAIDMLRDKLEAIQAQGGLPAHGFKPGDEVEIESGPLAGLRAVFQGPLRPAERVQILIRFLGHANRAEVPVELLRPVSNTDNAVRERRRGTRGRGRRIRYADEPSPSDQRSRPAGKPDEEGS